MGNSHENFPVIQNRFLHSSLDNISKENFEFFKSYPKSFLAEYLDLPLYKGTTPLCSAICQRDIDITRSLLSLGANPNQPDLRGATPLIYTAQINDPILGKMLLDAGADVNAMDHNNRTAAHYASYFGHQAFVDFLIKSYADFSIEDADGRIALDYARSISNGKNYKSLIDSISRTGCTKSSGKNNTVSPLKFDQNYILLDKLNQTVNSKDTWLYLVILVALISFVTNRIFPDSSYFYYFTVFIFSFFFSSILLVRPLISNTREIAPYQRQHSEFASIEEAIKASKTSARAIAGIIKQASYQVFREMSDDKFIPVRDTNYLSLFLIALIPALVLTPIQSYIYFPIEIFTFLFEIFKSNLPGGLGFFIYIIVWFIGFITLLVYIVLTILLFFSLLLFKIPHAIAISIVESNLLKRQRLQADLLDKLAYSLERKTMQKDCILYLRSFQQDGKCSIGYFGLESLLVYCFNKIHPVVALGFSTSMLGPAKVTATDDDWKAKVVEFSRDAKLIVMIPNDSDGVKWEIELLREKRYLNKTVFVAPPENQDKTNERFWEKMRLDPKLIDLEIPPYCDAGFVFTLNQDGKIRSSGPLGVDIPLVLFSSKKSDIVASDGDYDASDDNGSDGLSLQQQYTALQSNMQLVPVLLTAQAAYNDNSLLDGDAGNDGDGGGSGS